MWPRSRRCSSTKARSEGVRGDIAFVQSILETGWFSFAGSQIPPDANNFAGINAFDGRPGLPNCSHGDSVPSRCFATPQHGVLVQIQLLRSYADPSAKSAEGRFISAPSDRAGDAPIWEYFGGNNCPCGKLIWASASGYGIASSSCTRRRSSTAARRARACRTRPGPGTKSGSGYWEVTATRTCTRSATPGSSAIRTRSSGRTAHRRRIALDRQGLLAARPRRRHLHLRQRTLLRLDRRHAAQQARQRHGAHHQRRRATGSSPTTAGSSRSATRSSTARRAACRSTSRCSAWSARERQGLLAVRLRRRHLHLRRREVLRLARRHQPHVADRVDAAHRAGKGYWMMTQDGHVYRFGDAKGYGDIGGCGKLQRRGAAARVAGRQGLLDRDGQRQRDPVRRREEPRLPGDRRRPDDRVCSVRSSSHRSEGGISLVPTTHHGELGGTGLRGWLAHDAPATDPSNLLRVIPAEGGMRVTTRVAIVSGGRRPVAPALM